MGSNKIKRLLTALIITLLILTPLIYINCGREPINQAEIHEIQAISGFGEVLSERVINYIDNNPNADIDDLIDVDGIGPKRIKLLKGRFKWYLETVFLLVTTKDLR